MCIVLRPWILSRIFENTREVCIVVNHLSTATAVPLYFSLIVVVLGWKCGLSSKYNIRERENCDVKKSYESY